MRSYLREYRRELTLVALLVALLVVVAVVVGSVLPEVRGDTLRTAIAAPTTTTTTTTTPPPPEVADVTTTAERRTQIQATETLPPPPTTTTTPPIVVGLAGTTDPTRCTQYEQKIEQLAPVDGWNVLTMSRYMRRESGCCPGVRGGDIASTTCDFLGISTYSHRSDVGLLQINGINYDPSRCGTSCVVDETLWSLMDPDTNIRAAATLCQWWRDAGSSCYRPWKG